MPKRLLSDLKQQRVLPTFYSAILNYETRSTSLIGHLKDQQRKSAAMPEATAKAPAPTAKAAATQVIGAAKATDPTKKSNTPVRTAPFRIRPLGSAEKWLKILIYGSHGTGKTTLAASAADVEDMQDVLLVNLEAGELSIWDNPLVKHPDHIYDTGPITDFETAAHVLDFLRAHCRARDVNDVDRLKELQARFFGQNIDEIVEPIRFRSVILDSLRELEVYCIYQLLGIDEQNFKLDSTDDMEVPEWGTYKKNNQMLQILIRAYRDLPMHVIFCCP